ncbi:predicted protein [Lichtheimia corymbifera JMRC:FSU:9682]|uniref:Uncharacterized protein n=1 Tax=Lichtheimia corymbifera JMRC:FSU:9682 TaxID=1263082 RepID=A0A068RZZ6_9FUNG|nr:predicted protein [Lichtheimia corymbifera JMRC:FSU:9682]
MDLADSAPNLISTSSIFSFPSLPPIPNCCPIQVQLQPAIDCPGPTHHGKPAVILIQKALTEWLAHGVCTPPQHLRFLTLHLVWCTPLPRSTVTAFIPAVPISKVVIVSNSLRYLAAAWFTAFYVNSI